MKRDIHNKIRTYENWRKEINSKGYIEEGLTKENTKRLLDFIEYLEERGRTKRTLYENRNKTKVLMKIFQERGFNDMTKLKEKDVLQFFKEWIEEGHTSDYIKRFKAFWNYWMRINRRKGITVQDIIQDLRIKEKESMFVWITKKQLNELCEYLNEEEEIYARFEFDSILRHPSESFNIKVENISENNKEEVWINVPEDISKTFGRKFNLVYTGDMILKYIKDKELKPEDYLFNISPVYFNRKIQKIAEKIWGDQRSEGGELFKKITGYDFRHSGAIHFRQLFQKTGQSLDSLRHRGGWTDFKMLNYYTKLLGLDGHIDKEKTLLSEDKSKLENDVEDLKKKLRTFTQLAVDGYNLNKGKVEYIVTGPGKAKRIE